MTAAVTTVEATTLGECWLRTSAAILEHGADAAYDGLAIKELAHLALSVTSPDPEDELIARLGDPAWSRWMHENFFSLEDVPELGNARSYAARLFDYEGSGATSSRGSSSGSAPTRSRGRPRSRPSSRCTTRRTSRASACSTSGRRRAGSSSSSTRTASTSARRRTGTSSSSPACRSCVAGELRLPLGALTIYVKSAHVYEPEWALMAQLVGSPGQPASAGDGELKPLPARTPARRALRRA